MDNLKVIVLKPTLKKETSKKTTIKRRVCGYARVSTDKDEQFTSYESQVEYYRKYIESNPSYEFVKIYTDEGISGTSINKRSGFKSMIQDCLDHKIDLIVTKSISRFARNTVNSLSMIRLLKDNNVEVFFEKENIYTFDSKGELLITIMSSIAQEESRSISQNVTWGIRQRMAKGVVTMPAKSMLGFKRVSKGAFEIEESEIPIVRSIYYMYLDGYSFYDIAKELTKEKVKSPMGKDIWYQSTIKSILTNEKYVGDSILQKTYTKDFLTKKKVINKGEVTKYYIKDHHKGIIDRDLFDRVNKLIDSNPTYRDTKEYKTINQKIYCPYCGMQYIKRTYRHNDKTTVFFSCLGYTRNKCENKMKYENFEFIKKEFIKSIKTKLNQEEKENIINHYKLIYDISILINELNFLDNVFYTNEKFCKKRKEAIKREIDKRNEIIESIMNFVHFPNLRFKNSIFFLMTDKVLIDKTNNIKFLFSFDNDYEK